MSRVTEKAQHTPGPWTLDPGANGWSLINNGQDVTAEPFDCSEADARLIAAAPEMLAALRRFLTAEREQSEGIRSQAAAMARVAIAQAEGTP